MGWFDEQRDDIRDVVATIAATTIATAVLGGAFAAGMVTGPSPAQADEPAALVCVDSNVLHTPSAKRMTSQEMPTCVLKLDLVREACAPHAAGKKVEVCTFVDGRKTACESVVSADGT